MAAELLDQSDRELDGEHVLGFWRIQRRRCLASFLEVAIRLTLADGESLRKHSGRLGKGHLVLEKLVSHIDPVNSFGL